MAAFYGVDPIQSLHDREREFQTTIDFMDEDRATDGAIILSVLLRTSLQ